ncbi:glycogen synthase [Candidatus Uabimicrobium sp. HlEnr_7]|uniref:glycogen synthase n=1 Tax=Candidatus Uabimicrobium helgolandensis TaxID=3095367 RepID=UPI003556B33D
MHIVMLSSECSPIAKVGGLADVVIGLSKSLQEQGHQVNIILPKYDCMQYDQIFDLQTVYYDLPVMYRGEWHVNDVMSGVVEGIKCYFIDAKWYKHFFNRGKIYGESDDIDRFAFFSKAAMEFMFKVNIEPDIIHSHDWTTALVNILQREIYYKEGMNKPRLVYTVHNFAHQGIAHESVLDDLGVGSYLIPQECRENDHSIFNFMKTAVVYADYITTVSPNYANEVQLTEKGMGLQYLLNKYHHKFSGIINGIDSEYWNPKDDKYLSDHYDVDSVDKKYKNKEALREKFWLRNEYKPIVAVVSRLVQQKGVDLIKHGIFYSLSQGAQFVLLGSSPNPQISQEFAEVKELLNDNPDCHLEFGFNEALSHLVYAGADIILIPSLFEPCGLTQLIGMRYGTVPVARLTGGLADTVYDVEYGRAPEAKRNGYTFIDATKPGVEFALGRAIHDWFEEPKQFRKLIKNGMKSDFSWEASAKKYVKIYKYLHSQM